MLDIFDVSKRCKDNKWRAYIKGDSIYLQNEVGEVALIGDTRESARKMITSEYEICIGCEYNEKGKSLCTRPIGVKCIR